MGKARILFGTSSTSPVSAATAEAAASEYFYNRALSGNFAPRPPIEGWSADQRERFEAELARGGTHDLDNLVGSCRSCNEKRGAAEGRRTIKKRTRGV